MANYVFHGFRRIRLHSLLKTSSLRSIFQHTEPIFTPLRPLNVLCESNPLWVFKNFSHGSVNLVISQGNPRFETHEIDPPKKEKWLTKKRLKVKRKKEKQKRKSANKRDPRKLGVKGKKGRQRFANAEERIKYKLEKAKIKEGLLLERLKRYEVPKLQGPLVKPHELTGEERFYMKKMAQKGSNYVPVGRRGVFGGVILNMHMHWKKHETVKVICKPCKPGQLKEYADEIARLSGGIPIHLIGDDTIIFYRGKDYVQPKVMSPIDTLSKKRALEKSKYEQSLESVRRFIAIADKELELYYRHIALYGDPSNRNRNNIHNNPRKGIERPKKVHPIEKDSSGNGFNAVISGTETDSAYEDLSENEDDEDLALSDLDGDDGSESDSCDEETEGNSSCLQVNSSSMLGSGSVHKTYCMDSNNQEFVGRTET